MSERDFIKAKHIGTILLYMIFFISIGIGIANGKMLLMNIFFIGMMAISELEDMFKELNAYDKRHKKDKDP